MALATLRAWWSGSLRRQMILAIAGVHATMVGAFVWDTTERQKNLLLLRQIEQTQALAQSVATSAAGWVAARDIYGLQEIVAAQRRYPELQYAMILDRQGKILAHSDPQRVGQYLHGLPARPEAHVLAHTAERVDVVEPVVLAQAHVGWVRVGLGQTATAAEMGNLTRSGIVYGLLAVLIGTLVAWYIGSRLTRRLRDMQQVADKVRAGNYAERLDPRGHDEIARLAGEFNAMLDSLVASRAELAESEKRWIRALEASGLGVWDWNAVTDKVYFSGTWKAQLGLAADAVGDDLSEWSGRVHPDDLPDCRADLDTHFRGATAVYRNIHRMRHQDGSWRWILDQGMVFEWAAPGKPLRVVGTHTDITELRQAEEALRTSEARAHLIIESAPEAMLVADSEGRIVLANSRVSDLFGYPPGELVGQPVEVLIPEAMRERHAGLRADYTAHPVARPMGWLSTLFARRKNGSQFPVEVSLAPMQVQGATQIIASVVDISKRVAMEAELLAHRDSLEERVIERTEELEKARARAERLAQAKSEFLANMSHEIRTPLNAVLGYARIGARDQADPAARATYGRILDAGEHLLGVINDILDVSKIEAGKLGVEAQPFQLAAVIANAASFVAGIAKTKGIAYSVDAAADLPEWATGDPQRLQQILVNLLANAVKYTERGSVRLQVERAGERLRFSVRDTGIGLSPEQIERIFAPFEQADSSTTRRYGGTGLGLSISQALAGLMGGEITVTSTPGEGSCFVLSLPCVPAEAPAQADDPSRRICHRLAGLRVLAAEDVPVNRALLEDLLVHEGAVVMFAEDGQQAVERVQADGAAAFDVVLMDVQMPVMDGYEATRRIRALAPDLPVIGLTAHALQEEQSRCLAAGMLEHVVKPIDMDRLVTAITRHVAGAWQPPVVSARGAPARADAPATPGLVDWTALLARCQGRSTLVDKLAASVLANYADTPATLRRAARVGDNEALAFIAHSLKGMAGNLEAVRLQELAQLAEAGARAGRAEAGELAHELAALLETLLQELATRSPG